MTSRLEAHAIYSEALAACETDAQRVAALRHLCRTDRFFLLVYVLGRKDVDTDWLYARCREVQAAPYGHLDLWARFHFKSSIITFAGIIQEILNNPNVTVCIFSHTRPIAKGFLVQIKRELEDNQGLKDLFPDILWANPRTEAPRWSEDNGLIVKRTSNPKESTLEAWGLVDGQPTSKHFDRLVYDDIVTRESVTTPEMMAKVTDAWALSLNLGHPTSKTMYAGTRYHYSDTYRTIMDRTAAIPRIYPATVDGTVDGEPVLLTPEALAEHRRLLGPYIFSCQLLLDPKADETQGFNVEWLNHWPGKDWTGMNVYIIVDPASAKGKSNDYTTMQVIGLAEDENYYWIAGIRDRLNLTERGEALMRMHKLYRPKAVGYEQYGVQADIEFIQRLQNERNYRFKITPLGGKLSKADRIKRLVPIMERGRWYMPAMHQYQAVDGENVNVVNEFELELDSFPVGAHDDLIDGAARILDEDLNAEFPSEVRNMKMANAPKMANNSYSPHRWRA